MNRRDKENNKSDEYRKQSGNKQNRGSVQLVRGINDYILIFKCDLNFKIIFI
jgi:hypothetical protein